MSHNGASQHRSHPAHAVKKSTWGGGFLGQTNLTRILLNSTQYVGKVQDVSRRGMTMPSLSPLLSPFLPLALRMDRGLCPVPDLALLPWHASFCLWLLPTS